MYISCCENNNSEEELVQEKKMKNFVMNHSGHKKDFDELFSLSREERIKKWGDHRAFNNFMRWKRIYH
uniref:Uncharacterized protein n=1 Tax=Marseillevirus LCMAC101 TaxID=2506602 RepID=A0A481YRP9_9VIRU|nr:MAG: hypothetical protein LCMAC101_05380 [Marseillevirus LCMAC101]